MIHLSGLSAAVETKPEFGLSAGKPRTIQAFLVADTFDRGMSGRVQAPRLLS